MPSSPPAEFLGLVSGVWVASFPLALTSSSAWLRWYLGGEFLASVCRVPRPSLSGVFRWRVPRLPHSSALSLWCVQVASSSPAELLGLSRLGLTVVFTCRVPRLPSSSGRSSPPAEFLASVCRVPQPGHSGASSSSADVFRCRVPRLPGSSASSLVFGWRVSASVY